MRRPHSKTRNFAGGFTLLELTATIAVAAIIAAVAVPNLAMFVKNMRLKSETYDLLDSFNLARSEAVKRKVQVILCRSANPDASTPSCGGTSSTWTTGWLVFASGDSNTTYNAGTDTLLARDDSAPSGVRIRTNMVADASLVYNPDGTANSAGNTARFAVCDDRGESVGRQVTVGSVGRAVVIVGTPAAPLASCTNPS